MNIEQLDEHWLAKLREIESLWEHDGNPNRPFARLASDYIASTYVNVSAIVSRPELLDNAALDMSRLIEHEYPKLDPARLTIVGIMEGSMILGHYVARYLGGRYFYMSKKGDGSGAIMDIASRFDAEHHYGHDIIVVDDITTTGQSAIKCHEQLKKLGFNVLPIMPCVLSWHENEEIDDKLILPLTRSTMTKWQEGKNPFTEDGTEPVVPVRPKSERKHLLWEPM